MPTERGGPDHLGAATGRHSFWGTWGSPHFLGWLPAQSSTAAHGTLSFFLALWRSRSLCFFLVRLAFMVLSQLSSLLEVASEHLLLLGQAALLCFLSGPELPGHTSYTPTSWGDMGRSYLISLSSLDSELTKAVWLCLIHSRIPRAPASHWRNQKPWLLTRKSSRLWSHFHALP